MTAERVERPEIAMPPYHPTEIAERGTWAVLREYEVEMERLETLIYAEQDRRAALEAELQASAQRNSGLQREVKRLEEALEDERSIQSMRY